MPFKSAKQERYMWVKHPDIAKRWSDTYGSYEHPKGSAPKRSKRSSRRGGR